MTTTPPNPKSDDADTSDADEVHTAALNGLLTLFSDRDLFDRVANDAADRRQADRTQHECELAKVDADIAKAEQAIERYLLAFEAGTLPDTQCGPRIREFGAKLVDLQDRRTQLHELLDSPHPAAPTAEQLAEARRHIRDAIDNEKHRKHLLQAVIAEIRVESREHITPVYRVPHAQQVDTVRAPETLVGLALHNANRLHTIDGPAITICCPAWGC
jgi:site-specific DNA recombinase